MCYCFLWAWICSHSLLRIPLDGSGNSKLVQLQNQALNQFYISPCQYCATAYNSIDREVYVSMALMFRSWKEGRKLFYCRLSRFWEQGRQREEIPAEFLAFSSFQKLLVQDLMMTWNIWIFTDDQQLQVLWKGFLTFFPPSRLSCKIKQCIMEIKNWILLRRKLTGSERKILQKPLTRQLVLETSTS